MRILFLTYSYLPAVGGVERSVANLSQQMVREGHAVTLVTHRGSALPLRWSGRGRPALLHLHIPAQDRSVAWRRAATAVLNLWNGAVLVAFCLLARIEVVHAHHLNADTGYARLLSRILGLPYVVTLRGGETEEWLPVNPRRRPYLIRVLESAARVTAVSRALLRDAARIVPSVEGRARVIPNPVEPATVAKLAATASRPEGSERPYLLFAGRLEYMKDVQCLIEAYQRLLTEEPDLRADLVILGAGALGAGLRELAAGGAGAERIRFLGARSHAETLGAIRDAEALVLPSRCSEGCPNVVLEAMSLDTPVVVSDLASLTEIVEDGFSGRIFPVGDRAALSRCLAAIGADEGERKRLARGARERVLRDHGVEQVVARYLELYSEVTARPT